MATTYAELQTETLAWLRNTAASEQVTNFISQVEDEANAKLRGVRRIIVATPTINAASSALPGDFQEVRSVRLTDGARTVPLVPITPERLAALKQDDDTTGEPEVYAIQGASMYFHPTPSASYAAELVYVGRLPRLSDSNTSNWLLAEFPSVYLNGALWRGYLYLKNAEMAEQYGGLFATGLADIRAANRTTHAPLLRTDFPLGGYVNADLTRA
jgi:hypothetical protein